MHSPMIKIHGYDTGMHPSAAPLPLQDPPRVLHYTYISIYGGLGLRITVRVRVRG